MDIISHSIDILFLLLALAFIPGSPLSRSSPSAAPTISLHSVDTTTTSDPPQSPAQSPLPSASSHLSVPSITITSDDPPPPTRPHSPFRNFGLGRRNSKSKSRPILSHKGRSVSFSLSSMDDLVPLDQDQKSLALSQYKHRPPTPFARAPKSPSELVLTPSPVSTDSHPPTPLTHAPHVEDPMGVKKQWLMA